MRPALTNLSARYTLTGGRPESWVTLETTVRPEVLARRDATGGLELVLPGLACAMAPGTISVRDGLVDHLEVRHSPPASLRVNIALDHAADFTLRTDPGLPCRTTVVLDRSHIGRLLAGRLIVLDPGHGGADGGARGPVNLWERDKCWEIALFASQFLREAGAAVVFTHRRDEDPSERARRGKARANRAQLYLSLHAGEDMVVGGRGARTVAIGPTAISRKLAEALQQAVLNRFPLPDLGVAVEPPDPALTIPAVRLEPLTITNGLDEALLRSPTFKRGLGLAVLTGVKNYLGGRK
ncbi:MAG: N-acetylmuramoyl-L-alanine amidase family protein [Symbiobacteriia bacterium]